MAYPQGLWFQDLQSKDIDGVEAEIKALLKSESTPE
jgi:hypothetical protein